MKQYFLMLVAAFTLLAAPAFAQSYVLAAPPPVDSLITRTEAWTAFSKVNVRLKENRTRIEEVAVTATTALSRADSLAAASKSKPTAGGAKKNPSYGFYTNKAMGKAVEDWANDNGLAAATREEKAEAFVQFLMASLTSSPPAGTPAKAPATTAKLDTTAAKALVDQLVRAKLANFDQRLTDLAAADSVQAENLRTVANVTAVALGAKDTRNGKEPSSSEKKAAKNWLASYGR